MNLCILESFIRVDKEVFGLRREIYFSFFYFMNYFWHLFEVRRGVIPVWIISEYFE